MYLCCCAQNITFFRHFYYTSGNIFLKTEFFMKFAYKGTSADIGRFPSFRLPFTLFDYGKAYDNKRKFQWEIVVSLFGLPQDRQYPPQQPMQVKLAHRKAHILSPIVYLCAPCKRCNCDSAAFRPFCFFFSLAARCFAYPSTSNA